MLCVVCAERVRVIPTTIYAQGRGGACVLRESHRVMGTVRVLGEPVPEGGGGG